MKGESKFVELIARQKDSGLSIYHFCSNEGIAPATFYYWKKKLHPNRAGREFIPLVVKTAPTVADPRPQGDDMLFEIRYPNGISLRVKSDLDLGKLRALLSLLD